MTDPSRETDAAARVADALVGGHKKYLEDFAASIDISYEELMNATRDWVAYGEYKVDGGKFEGQDVPDEFWDHYDAVENTNVETGKRQPFFSCSC